jgi:hypothetical protein
MAIDWLIALDCTLVVGDPQSTLCFVVPVTVSRSLPWIRNDWMGLHLPGLGNPVVLDRPCGVKVQKAVVKLGVQPCIL